jgi:CRISPR-associated endonuclease/helicase Cas3
VFTGGEEGMMSKYFIAHKRESDGKEQSLQDHLLGTAREAKRFASKIGLAEVGELLGLLHDLGKYSDAFQNYLKSAVGLINPDEDDYVNAKGLKGKIDHSTAGAQQVWRELAPNGDNSRLVAKVLSLCLASHHSGMIDYLSPQGEPVFSRRVEKREELTHIDEVLRKIDPLIQENITRLLHSPTLIEKLFLKMSSIKGGNQTVHLFKLGQFVRILYSCLIDADRTNTIKFERPNTVSMYQLEDVPDWSKLIKRFEKSLTCFKKEKKIDAIRAEISDLCLKAASRKKGIFTLTVPTGGGKTLSSMRFALHHAGLNKLDRIIYVIPFTTIIDQNAFVIRKILEPETEPYSSIVLEHHSNLTPDEESWRSKVLSENWDAPVIFTTSVQFLEALYGSGTRSVRRMHQLANSLIIFDEIQSLPIKCVHLFNNSINFLVESCGASTVLCTATQPLLNRADSKKGACGNDSTNEIIPDVLRLFKELNVLRNISVNDNRKAGDWSIPEIAEKAIQCVSDSGSCLVVANTKNIAKSVYKELAERKIQKIFHLSTDMCPAHRLKVLGKIRQYLDDGVPIICVSTQLIEAGVDIDFGSVIRCTAGLDSIAQAAGRCNRNASREAGQIFVVTPQNENLGKLQDIQKGKESAERVLGEFKNDPRSLGNSLLCPTAMERFYTYYFFNRKGEMDYPFHANSAYGIDRDDTLLSLLSENEKTICEYTRTYPHTLLQDRNLNQSFSTAGKIFKAIEAPTCGVMVPYRKMGKAIISKISAAYEPTKQYKLLKRAQRYSVNIFPWRFDKLWGVGALHEAQPNSGIYYLDERYYDDNFGLGDEPIKSQEPLIM